LGWRQLELPGGAMLPVALFSGGRTHHELLLIEVGPDAAPIPQGRRVGMYHFGLKVGDSDDELRAALARLREAGVPVAAATDHGVTHSLYIAEPDGNETELCVDVPGKDRTDPAELMARPRPSTSEPSPRVAARRTSVIQLPYPGAGARVRRSAAKTGWNPALSRNREAPFGDESGRLLRGANGGPRRKGGLWATRTGPSQLLPTGRRGDGQISIHPGSARAGDVARGLRR
jgi:hypothetical protein